MATEIRNRVAESGIITIDPSSYYSDGERVLFDIAPILFEGMILREKDFRDFVKGHEWSSYSGKLVAITCTADAVIPAWAYMLITTALKPYAGKIVLGDLDDLEKELLNDALAEFDPIEYADKRVMIKGCGEKNIPRSVFVKLTDMLIPHVKSIMYGEPCSSVPVYRKK